MEYNNYNDFNESQLITKYTNVCAQIDEDEKQLVNMCIENFVLNPEIAKLTSNLKELKEEKKILEDIINGRE